VYGTRAVLHATSSMWLLSRARRKSLASATESTTPRAPSDTSNRAAWGLEFSARFGNNQRLSKTVRASGTRPDTRCRMAME